MSLPVALFFFDYYVSVGSVSDLVWFGLVWFYGKSTIVGYRYVTQPVDCNEHFLLLLIPGEYSSRWRSLFLPNTLVLRQTFNNFFYFYLCCIKLSLIYLVPCKPEFVSFFRTLNWSTTVMKLRFPNKSNNLPPTMYNPSFVLRDLMNN